MGVKITDPSVVITDKLWYNALPFPINSVVRLTPNIEQVVSAFFPNHELACSATFIFKGVCPTDEIYCELETKSGILIPMVPIEILESDDGSN